MAKRTDTDPRNKLNDLSNHDWIIATKSVWYDVTKPRFTDADREAFTRWLIERKGQDDAEIFLEQLWPSVVISNPPKRDELKILHPATFSEKDVGRLITLFSKEGETILDPFLGSGSTLVSCQEQKRVGIGIDIVPLWVDLAKKRVGDDPAQTIICGDSREALGTMSPNSIDFIITSPPYWNILQYQDGPKIQAQRIAKGLPTQYSEMPEDLGNTTSYPDFLTQLYNIFQECTRVLSPKKYMCIIVRDFRIGQWFIPFHSDITTIAIRSGLTLQGTTVLIQDNRGIFPYGIPYAFVSNIVHGYVLIFRKMVK